MKECAKNTVRGEAVSHGLRPHISPHFFCLSVHTAAPKFYLPQRCLSENIFCDNLEEDIGSYRWLEQYLQVLSLQSK